MVTVMNITQVIADGLQEKEVGVMPGFAGMKGIVRMKAV